MQADNNFDGQTTKQNGRPRRRGYSEAQLSLIENGRARGCGYKKIAAEYPHSGLTCSGVKEVLRRIKKNGDANRKKGSGRTATKCTNRNIATVDTIIRDCPNSSIRGIGKQAGLKKTTVAKILKQHLKKKCLKTAKAQKLSKGHPAKRVKACQKMLGDIKQGALDYKNIFFADEKIPRVGSEANESSQNRRCWVDKDIPKKKVAQKHIVRGKSRGGISVMCSLGVSSRGVGTLSFVERGVKINKEVYLDLVKNAYYPDMRMTLGNDAVFMQDGATSHTAKVVTAFIKTCDFKVLEPWPANSPDLTVMDYAIWGILCGAAQKQNPGSEVDLKVAIRRAVMDLGLDVVQRAVDQFPKRLAMCVECEGENFEYKM